MAPKLAMKKVKGKAKAKGNANATKVVTEKLATEQRQIMTVPEKQPNENSLAWPIRKNVQELLKTSKSVEEALANSKVELVAMNQRLEEAAQIQEQHDDVCKAATPATEPRQSSPAIPVSPASPGSSTGPATPASSASRWLAMAMAMGSYGHAFEETKAEVEKAMEVEMQAAAALKASMDIMAIVSKSKF